MRTKILIIKLGYSETLDEEIGKVPSLGDVLRTTPILWALEEKYPEAEISWLVSSHAEPLLRDNPHINRIMVWDEFVPFQLMREKFDVLVNLEKIPGVCAVADMIDAWVKYGFRFDSLAGSYHAYERGLAFIEYIQDKKKASRPKELWDKVLVEMLGVEWREQPLIIGYKPRAEETFDIGFNYTVGTKWPTKALSESKWKILEERFQQLGYSITWQQGMDNLFDYMDWINSCRLIISNDSLGLHLGIGLKKAVIGLFGPTDSAEIPGIEAICARQECVYKPCYRGRCATGFNCMESIDLNRVVEAGQRKLLELKGEVPGINLNRAIEKIAAVAEENAKSGKELLKIIENTADDAGEQDELVLDLDLSES